MPVGNMQKSKLIVVAGPTASGKSELGIKLAKKFNGEIVSADSRQIYWGMDIGTGKTQNQESIPHHGIDIADPAEEFTVAQYQKFAVEKIQEMLMSHKNMEPVHHLLQQQLHLQFFQNNELLKQQHNNETI